MAHLLLLLQKKVNVYLDFIVSGDIYNQYPDATGKPVSIQILRQYEVPDDALEFYRRCAVAAKGIGSTFAHKLLSRP